MTREKLTDESMYHVQEEHVELLVSPTANAPACEYFQTLRLLPPLDTTLTWLQKLKSLVVSPTIVTPDAPSLAPTCFASATLTP